MILAAFGAAIFLASIVAPPSLMDDVDAVNAQIARNMLESGDWVTARINGVAYLEKSPLGFWLMAASYAVFGPRDWAARLPSALGAIGLMWATAALGRWGLGRRAGFYSGLAVGASAGLFLFTRIVIPDVLLALAVTLALYCFLRAIEEQNRRWALGYWACIGAGMLLKGLLAALVPVAVAGLYLLLTRRLFEGRTWRAMRPALGVLLMLAIYAPWVVLASIRNPPVFDLAMRSEPGVYRGFFWFYFINEHVLRFLNLRYPRDYNTAPRALFLALHLVWIFPWSAFLPAALRLPASRLPERAARLRLLALLWIGFLLAFLSFSTTQEYYSMPCYPAFAVLVGAGLTLGARRWVAAGYGALAAAGVSFAAIAGVILYRVRGVEAAGDISSALTQNPEAYTLSLGHMQDLTLASFAYLRGPLVAAAAALGIGATAAWMARRKRFAPLILAAMMTVLAHAARSAMAVFDPYLSSRPLAEAIDGAPEGRLVIEGHYYPASSVAFYTNRQALLWNGRRDNLVYGAAAPGAPAVFLEDADLARLWRSGERVYLVAPSASRARLEELASLREETASGIEPRGEVKVLAERGGKMVATNRSDTIGGR